VKLSSESSSAARARCRGKAPLRVLSPTMGYIYVVPAQAVFLTVRYRSREQACWGRFAIDMIQEETLLKKNRDDYAAQNGNERFLVLFRRKVLGPLQRRAPVGAFRRFLAQRLGVKIEVEPGEKPVWIGPEVYLDDTFPELITLRPGAVLGVRCMILCHDDAKRLVAPVVIGKRSFIGAGAIVLPGVEIGESAVVGAGAVVARSVPPRETWGGVPARPIATNKLNNRKGLRAL